MILIIAARHVHISAVKVAQLSHLIHATCSADFVPRCSFMALLECAAEPERRFLQARSLAAARSRRDACCAAAAAARGSVYTERLFGV